MNRTTETLETFRQAALYGLKWLGIRIFCTIGVIVSFVFLIERFL